MGPLFQQRSAKARPKVVHVDKLKVFWGIPPSSWLDTRTAPDEGDASYPPLAAADQSSPEPGVSSAKTAEGTAMSVSAVDDSPAEGQPPKAADEVLETVPVVEMVAAEGPVESVAKRQLECQQLKSTSLEIVPVVEKVAAEGPVESVAKRQLEWQQLKSTD